MPKIEICIDYATKDEKYRDTLLKWLGSATDPWKQQGLISIWHRGLILPGYNSAEEIAKHRRSAKLFLFLVSSDFMADDFYNSPAMDELLRRHKAGEVHIIPILLRPSLWKMSSSSALEPLPDNGIPLTSWNDKDEALLNITEGLTKSIASLLASP